MREKYILLFRKVKNCYMNLKITSKLVIGYFIVVLVPTFALEWSFYQSNYTAFVQNYLLNQQYSLNIAKQNFDTQMDQITSSTVPFENNSILHNYLLRYYDSVSESLYHYLQNIKFLYTISNNNPYLINLTVYGYSKYPIDLQNRLTSLENIDIDKNFIEKVKKNSSGIWKISLNESATPQLYYYKMIYSSIYPYYLGIIKLTVKIPDIFNSFNSLSNNELYLYDETSNNLYNYDGNTLTLSNNTLENLYQNNDYIQTADIKELSCRIIQINHVDSILSYNGIILLIVLIILFLVLTSLYYLIAASITGRLKVFNQYVKKTDVNNLVEFPAPIYTDEIGAVISSHNNLIQRINQLTYENYQSQLQKKDAEYYALQAQIKPHFLYNILENIRMSAETHNDYETADMLTSLGKHMRYSLNMKSNNSTLENELYFAKNYLQMQKIRLKDKIQIKISVQTELDDIYCPRLILQPIIENAIKHGYCIGQVLHISIYVKEGIVSACTSVVLVEIIDNGNGIDKDTLAILRENFEQVKVDSHHHVGLNNVNSRLITFYGSKEGYLNINSELGQGTVVSFYLRKNQKPLS